MVFFKEKEESLVQLLPALKPIGYLQSIFKNKNGTPRQSGICSSACASLKIDSNLFSNAHHSLEGLHAYSHLWYVLGSSDRCWLIICAYWIFMCEQDLKINFILLMNC